MIECICTHTSVVVVVFLNHISMLHISNAIYLEKKTHAKMTKNSLTGKVSIKTKRIFAKWRCIFNERDWIFLPGLLHEGTSW